MDQGNKLGKTKMENLAKLAIAEMSDEMKSVFINADSETRVKLAIAFAQDATDKQETIKNTLCSYPHKMAGFKTVIFDSLTS